MGSDGDLTDAGVLWDAGDASLYGRDARAASGDVPEAVQAIFDRACAGAYCHVGATAAAAQLDLSAGAALANLVDVAAQEAPSLKRVQPGDAASSFLMCKLDPDCAALVGSRMPLDAAPLSVSDLEVLRSWIDSLTDVTTDRMAPSFAGLQSAESTQEGAALLTWQPAQDDTTGAGALVYRIYSAIAAGAQDFNKPASTIQGQTSLSLTGLVPGSTYYFVVRASDRAGNTDGNSVERALQILDATPPSFAGLNAATATGGDSVALAWLPASDNGGAGALRYRVYMATQSGGQDFTAPLLTTTAGATQVSVSGLQDATLYYFVVRAVDRAGLEDANTQERSATTLDVTAPSFDGAASAQGNYNAVQLAWSAASDAVTPAQDLVYLIYRASSSGAQSFDGPAVQTAPGATAAAIGGLHPATQYYFVVRARDAAGNVDANMVEVSATTLSGSDNQPPTFAGVASAVAGSETTVNLSWAAASDNVSAASQISYAIYRGSSPSLAYTTPAYTTQQGATSFVAGGLAANTTYWFAVRARDQAGNEDTNTNTLSAKTWGDTTPPTFGGLASATAQSSDGIALAWAPASDNVTVADALVYDVYRSESSGAESFGTASYTTSPGATSFIASGLAADTRYYFVVRARDANGNSDSNTVEKSAMTLGSVSFAADVQPIFSANCSGNCHGGAAPSKGLNLSSAVDAYAGLVNRNSTECTAVKLVEPSSPQTSYLMWKLHGSGPTPQSCFSGSQMPKTGSVTSNEQAIINSWIVAGAPNN